MIPYLEYRKTAIIPIKHYDDARRKTVNESAEEQRHHRPTKSISNIDGRLRLRIYENRQIALEMVSIYHNDQSLSSTYVNWTSEIGLW